MKYIRYIVGKWFLNTSTDINNGEHWLSKRKYPHLDNDNRVVFFYNLFTKVCGWKLLKTYNNK